MTREHVTTSERETYELGKTLGACASRGDVFAIFGDLGVGKTILAKGIASGMGVTDEVSSPTFSLLEIYESPLPLYHFDLYRIERPEELETLGFDEYWEGDGVSVIEWAERAGGRLPAETISIIIFAIDENTRRITVEHPVH